MKPPRFVEVEWNDAQANGAATFDAAVHHKPCVMYTRGWLVKQDEAGVSVACERYQEEGQWHYRGSTFVPAGMIVKVRATR